MAQTNLQKFEKLLPVVNELILLRQQLMLDVLPTNLQANLRSKVHSVLHQSQPSPICTETDRRTHTHTRARAHTHTHPHIFGCYAWYSLVLDYKQD